MLELDAHPLQVTQVARKNETPSGDGIQGEVKVDHMPRLHDRRSHGNVQMFSWFVNLLIKVHL